MKKPIHSKKVDNTSKGKEKRKPSSSGSVRTTVYINKEHYKKLRIWAIKEELTITEAIACALDKFLSSINLSFIQESINKKPPQQK